MKILGLTKHLILVNKILLLIQILIKSIIYVELLLILEKVEVEGILLLIVEIILMTVSHVITMLQYKK